MTENVTGGQIEMFRTLIAPERENRRSGTARVVGFFANGEPRVQFDNENTPRNKQYARNAAYEPEIGDRVFMQTAGGTYIIAFPIIYRG